MNDPAAVVAALESAPAILLSLIREIPSAVLKRRPAPGKWSAHEHACHLAGVQPLFLARLDRMLAERHPVLEPYEPEVDEQEGELLMVDLDEALERFTRERAEIVGRLKALAPADWERTAVHPEFSPYTVFRMFRYLALHDLFHGYRIQELLLKKDWPQAHPAAAAIPGLHSTLRAGKVNLLGPFEVPGLTPRQVRVYLPREYHWQGEPRFALYMFDGQNMFDDAPSFSGGWHIDEAVERLARTRRPVPVVVGIDHAGPGRIRELSPFPFEGEPGQIESLLDWLTGELMPALAAELHLATGPLGAIVGGSSMGGLAALYAHFRHPEAFGGALSMSPALWIAHRAVFDWIAAQPLPPVSRVYLDCGAREGRGSLLPMVAAMAALLAERGYDADRLVWRPDPRGVHNEASWRRRLPKALRFLYRPRETGELSARSGGVVPERRV